MECCERSRRLVVETFGRNASWNFSRNFRKIFPARLWRGGMLVACVFSAGRSRVSFDHHSGQPFSSDNRPHSTVHCGHVIQCASHHVCCVYACTRHWRRKVVSVHQPVVRVTMRWNNSVTVLAYKISGRGACPLSEDLGSGDGSGMQGKSSCMGTKSPRKWSKI